MGALTKAGFQLPPEQYPSNLLGTHYYDQIAFRTRKDELTFLSSGAFDWSQTLFRPDHYEHYAPVLPKRHRDLKPDGSPRDTGKDKDYYSKRWLTWQMSDHLPLWVELAIDFSDAHLLHNVKGAFEAGDVAAQVEYTEEAEPVAAPPEPAEPVRPLKKKRKAPKVAAPEKQGTLAPTPRLGLKEAWRIFWWVALGGGDRMRKAKEAGKKAARPRKAPKKPDA